AEHRTAVAALQQALAERPRDVRGRARIVTAPAGYVSGEESAAVHYVNAGDARPTTTPPRPFERGVGGRPTLVQNVESLAAAALIARGDDASTGLVTLSGAVRRAGVQEIALDAPLAGVAAAAGGPTRAAQAVLLGGYFGAFAHIADVWALPLQPRSLRARGLTVGWGVIHFVAADASGLNETGRMLPSRS